MTNRSLRFSRTALLILALSAAFTGLALASEAPMSVDLLPGEDCAPAMSLAAQADLSLADLAVPEPTLAACFYAIYDEWVKDYEVCMWRNSCTGQRWGSCPDGYDYHTSEIFPCCR